MTYANLILYSSAAPQYDDEEEEKWDESLDANNPNNFKGKNNEEEFV